MKFEQVKVEGVNGSCLMTETGQIMTLEDIEELMAELKAFYEHLAAEGVETLISTSDGKLMAFRKHELPTLERRPLTEIEVIALMEAESQTVSLDAQYNIERWDDEDDQ